MNHVARGDDDNSRGDEDEGKEVEEKESEIHKIKKSVVGSPSICFLTTDYGLLTSLATFPIRFNVTTKRIFISVAISEEFFFIVIKFLTGFGGKFKVW